MKSNFLCLLLMLCCTGCVLSYSVSNHAEYRPYIGQTVTLTRPMLLVGHITSFAGAGGIATKSYARYCLTEQERQWAPEPLFAKLPKGYTATVDSVHAEITGDEQVKVVYGQIVNPVNGERASFSYTLYQLPFPWQLGASSR